DVVVVVVVGSGEGGVVVVSGGGGGGTTVVDTVGSPSGPVITVVRVSEVGRVVLTVTGSLSVELPVNVKPTPVTARSAAAAAPNSTGGRLYQGSGGGSAPSGPRRSVSSRSNSTGGRALAACSKV